MYKCVGEKEWVGGLFFWGVVRKVVFLFSLLVRCKSVWFLKGREYLILKILLFYKENKRENIEGWGNMKMKRWEGEGDIEW